MSFKKICRVSFLISSFVYLCALFFKLGLPKLYVFDDFSIEVFLEFLSLTFSVFSNNRE